MSDDPKPLAMVAKFPAPPAAKYGDQVTPLQLLEELLASARKGDFDPETLVVVAVYSHAGGGQSQQRMIAGPASMAEEYVYLTIAQSEALERMRA